MNRHAVKAALCVLMLAAAVLLTREQGKEGDEPTLDRGPGSARPVLSTYQRFVDNGKISALLGEVAAAPSQEADAEPAGEYKVSYYWITCEDDFPSGGEKVSIEIWDPVSGLTRTVPVGPEFKKALDLEGTAILHDLHVINVSSASGGADRYVDVTATSPTGLGCRSNPLTPFISVAVARRGSGLDFGDTLWIPAFRGLMLPDGRKHKGFFKVEDRGRLSPDQLDVFVFLKSYARIFNDKLPTGTRVTVFKVVEPETIRKGEEEASVERR